MTTGRSSRPIGAPAESGESGRGGAGPSTDAPEDDVEKPAPAGPAIVADASGQSLGGYLRALWSRILAGQSGVLPVVLGVALIAIIFQVQNASFLTPGNLVNLLVQGAVFMLIGMGESLRASARRDRSVARIRRRHRRDRRHAPRRSRTSPGPGGPRSRAALIGDSRDRRRFKAR